MLRKNAKNVEKSRILHNFFEFERFDPFSKSVHNMTNHAPLRAVILRYESCDSELSIREIAGQNAFISPILQAFGNSQILDAFAWPILPAA